MGWYEMVSIAFLSLKYEEVKEDMETIKKCLGINLKDFIGNLRKMLSNHFLELLEKISVLLIKKL